MDPKNAGKPKTKKPASKPRTMQTTLSTFIGRIEVEKKRRWDLHLLRRVLDGSLPFQMPS
jgi:hypothetical protein